MNRLCVKAFQDAKTLPFSSCELSLVLHYTVLMYDPKANMLLKNGFSLKQCHLGKSYPHPQQWPAQLTAQAQNGGSLAGSAPKRPHHPTATDLIGMKDPDSKLRLTQNGGHRLLAERCGISTGHV